MAPKYNKPKIMLIDMPNACESVLQDAGYNIAVGTFGIPYEVDPSDTFHPVATDSHKLPNCAEQEIVIANLERPSATGTLPTDPGDGVSSVWQLGTQGRIDPRPLVMANIQEAFDRIIQGSSRILVGAA